MSVSTKSAREQPSLSEIQPTWLGLLLFVNFSTAGLGMYLTGQNGKLAISNLTPIAFIVFAAIPFLTDNREIRRDFLRYLILFNLGCVTSYVIFLFLFSWKPDLLVLLFQDVEILFCALLILFSRDNWAEFRLAVLIGIYASIPISLYFGYEDHANGVIALRFGMDDKSQGAVFLCMEAFILLRFFRGPINAIVGLALFGMSFLTISRLPAFFIPAILLASAARSRMGLFFVALVCATVAGLLAVYTQIVESTFTVINRLSSLGALGSNSTLSHLALIRAALSIKFSHLLPFLFGTGPGNFSKALISFSPPELAKLHVVDPKLLVDAHAGRTPMHSTIVQLLFDYSLPTFLLLVYGVYRALRRIALVITAVDWLFIIGLFFASLFYSIHDKHYFFLLGITIFLLFVHRIDEAPIEELPTTAPPSMIGNNPLRAAVPSRS